MKIVINADFGGFGLSEAAYRELGRSWDGFGHGEEIARNDPRLVEVVERLGAAANGRCAHLKVVEIPDDVEWEIEDYDGAEWVSEKHRRWE